MFALQINKQNVEFVEIRLALKQKQLNGFLMTKKTQNRRCNINL